MKKIFRTLLLTAFLVVVTLCSYSQKNMTEIIYAPEDAAFGINVSKSVFGDFNKSGIFGILVGAEKGIYRSKSSTTRLSKIEHEKYRIGISHISQDYNTSSFYGDDIYTILYVAACYNEYDIIYNLDNFINPDNLHKITFEFGVKTTISRDYIVGFNFDVIQTTGAFTVGVLF